MNLKVFKQTDFDEMPKRFRTQFFNSLSGFKSANLVGTKDENGVSNLAIISSVIHLGANPSLMGMIIRPASVPRHTLENILETKFFTINHVNEKIYKQAHQTSAKYEKEISEFQAVGLSEEYIDDFFAPYVKASNIKIGLQLKETITIKSNNTIMVVGEVLQVAVNEISIASDGYIDIENSGTIAVSGLDNYHKTERISRLSYAKVDKAIDEI